MNRLERKKIIQVILGTSMIALAITLLITAHKGADTISVFLLGMLTLIDIRNVDVDRYSLLGS